jgi:hypothetical protein
MLLEDHGMALASTDCELVPSRQRETHVVRWRKHGATCNHLSVGQKLLLATKPVPPVVDAVTLLLSNLKRELQGRWAATSNETQDQLPLSSPDNSAALRQSRCGHIIMH